ncbi:MAG TPA: FliM/FliN family flagellar motor switch protein [Pirellulales bacterium]
MPAVDRVSAGAVENFADGERQATVRIEAARVKLSASLLRSGAVVVLPRETPGAIGLIVGGRRVAEGSLVVVDGKYAIRIERRCGFRRD